MDSKLFDGQTHLYNLVLNFVNSMVVKCATELGIADIIHSQKRPTTLSELASALEIHPSKTNALRRLMRFLIQLQLFHKVVLNDSDQQEEAYALTPSSTLLVKDNPFSLAPYVSIVLRMTTEFSSLSKWFKGNELTPMETTYGMNFWDYLEKQNPELGELFNQLMAYESQMAKLVIKDCEPIFQGIGSLVDVGGGTGTLSRIISESYPGIKCSVFDLPHVVAKCQDTENLKFVAGDMLTQSIPPADAILFKAIMHLFEDEVCVKLLKKCREVITSKGGNGGKLIIIDIVINENGDEKEVAETKLIFDMVMLVYFAGKERTEKEWASLFLEAGFSRYNIVPIFGFRSLIEVYP